MEIRAVLRDPKTFGRQQHIQWLLLASCNILNALHLVASVFISASVDFRCQIPGLKNDTFAVQGWEHNSSISQYIPLKSDGKYDSCHLRVTNTSQLETCNSYVYTTSIFKDTTVTEFNLVCDKTALSTLAGVVYMAGLFVGSIAFGAVSDKLGRKWTIYIGLCLQAVFALSIRFAPNLEAFISLRFLLGAVCIGGLVTQFTLMIEISPPNRRTISAIVQTLGWAVGVILLSGIGFALRGWRDLQLCLACISIPFILTYWWLLTESPTWLLSQGRFEEAVQIVKRIKELNNLEDVDTEQLVDTENEETQAKESWRKVLVSRTIIINILINSFGWFVGSMGYYGLALNVGNLVGDIYVNNLIGGIVEVFAYFLLLICLKAGRKPVYILLMSIGGVALIVSGFLIVYLPEEGLSWVIVTISMIGKFAVSAGFELIYFWSAEVYPTSMRNSMLGINSAAARVGGMVSPVIADIPKYSENMPFAEGAAPLIFGAFMLMSALSAFFLPETNNIPIPECVKDANELTYNYKGFKPYISKTKLVGEVEMTSTKSNLL
ncbi:organic cation transporter protein-like [Watersipora subatra]|uniref:organic cation transporter protein-like n=1 Tax=Watersipora subatra TaxID=2589382 RepID=UPI00355C4F9F